MKEDITKILDELVAEDIEAINELMKEDAEILALANNPEAFIGKPVAEWTPEDLSMLVSTFGEEAINSAIFEKEYAELEKMKKQEVQNA